MFRRRILAAALPAMLVSHFPLAHAQSSYPNRPIKLIVPFAPGGSTDLVARIYAEKLARILKTPVVVENKSGAGTVLGTDAVAKSTPDGYTILIATSAYAVNASLYPKLPYDSHTGLMPISLVAEVPMVVEVNPKVPAQNISQFVLLLRNNPSKYSFASAGSGSALHMAAELLKYQEKLDATHIAYRGAGPAFADVMAGQVDFIIDAVSTSLPFIKNGNIRALAVTSENRSSVLPDVPTMKESGFPEYTTTIWNMIMVPAGTPAPVRERLSDALAAASNDPELRQKLSNLGVDPLYTTPEVASQKVESEIRTWRTVIKAAGIRPE